MNDVNVLQKERGKSSFGLFDLVIAALVVSSLAFYDVKTVFLGLQMLAFFVTFLYVLNNTHCLKNHIVLYSVWLLLFAFYGLTSILWASRDNTTVISVTLSVVQVGLIAICILVYTDLTRKFANLLVSFIVSALALCARFFIMIPSSAWGNAERFSDDTIFGGNYPAMIMAYASVLLIWYCFFSGEKRPMGHKISALAMVVLFMFITMLMGTKKSLLIFGVCVLILVLGSAKNPVKLGIRIFAVIGLLVLLYYLMMRVELLYNSIGYRIESMMQIFTGGEADNSTVDRAFYTQDAFRVFFKHPILGVGQDGYRYANANTLTYSHNNYAEVAANLGVIGLFLFYSLHIGILRKCFRVFKRNMLPLCFMVAHLFTDVAAVSYSSESAYVIIALCFAIAVREEQLMRQDRSVSSATQYR